jgi:membrane-bound metal-dependent hydrolase YbcI (DUF457 family)
MYTSSTEPEWHPWLKHYTIMAVFEGLFFLIPSCGLSFEISRAPNPSGAVFVVILTALPSVALILASSYTLQATDYFRKWDRGVSQLNKFIGFSVVILGLMFSIALLFVPSITRFFTDAVGGGIGSNRRG